MHLPTPGRKFHQFPAKGSINQESKNTIDLLQQETASHNIIRCSWKLSTSCSN